MSDIILLGDYGTGYAMGYRVFDSGGVCPTLPAHIYKDNDCPRILEIVYE